jgi:FeoB-associated Cys-rich membrane protein
MQEVITYIIIAAASTVALYKFYTSVFAKKKTAGCGDCGCGKQSCSS